MPCYRFSVHSADGRDREDTGSIWLRDDDEACAFGKAIIADLMRGDAPYDGWTMSIADGKRTVCSIRFDACDSLTRTRRSLNQLGTTEVRGA